MNLSEANKPEVKKTVVVYSGRFQPFHKGHYIAYQKLVSKFGANNVYIGTSDKTDSGKSPFNFSEKKKIATTMFGVPADKFIQLKNPYAPVEILNKFDGKTTQYVAAVGEKDASRLAGKYFKPYRDKAGYGYEEIGYTYIVPAEKNPISGTDVRNGLGNKNTEKSKEFFLKAYPKFNKDIFNMITSKLNEEGMPGGIGVGLNLPGGYINGAPTGSVDESNNTKPASEMRPEPHPTRHEIEHSEDDLYDPIDEILGRAAAEEIFKEWLENYLGEAPNPIMDKEVSYTSKDGKKKKITVRGALRLPKDHEAHIQAAKLVGPDDAPANEPKGKAATQSQKPAQPGQPVKKGQTAQGKADAAQKSGEKPGQQAPPPEQKLSGAELKSDAEKRAKDDSTDKEKKEKEFVEKINKEIHKEKEHLSHEENQAYEFLDGMPDKDKGEAIDKALNDRSIWQKFTQDTMLGGFIAKKQKQIKETGNGIASFVKGIASGRGPSAGITKDCSGAPAGPHAPKSDNLNEAASDRQDYLKSLGKDGKPKQSEPVDKSKCKDVHYSDYQKRDDNGKPMFEKKKVPVYKQGKTPDPANFGKDGAYFGGLGTGYIGPRKAGTEHGNASKEDAFKASELDSKTGYFKRDGKYYDGDGEEVNKNGNTLGADGKPQQKKTLFGKPKTQTIETPVYEDNLTPEQSHAAHHSHHASHEEKHAMKHTAIEAGLIVGGAVYGPAILSKMGLGHAAAEGGAHGAAELAKHIAKDAAKHATLEMLGVSNAPTAGAGGLAISAATGGILELLIRDRNILLENQDPEADKKFMMKLMRATMEKLKTFKMTPEQKLESLKSYRLSKGNREKEQQAKDLANLLKEDLSDSKKQNIQHFIEYATKRLKLKENPKITLIGGKEYGNVKSSLGGYSPEDKTIYVATEGRLTADILRTIAHEMVHRKQDEMGYIKDSVNDGRDGSKIENQAHSIAGILMREYGRINKQIYNEDVNVDVDKGDTVLMGKFKNKKVQVKDIGTDDHGMPTINGKQATTFRTTDEAFTKGQLFAGKMKVGGKPVNVEVELLGADNKKKEFITRIIHVDKGYERQLPIGSTLPIPARIFRTPGGGWRKIKTPSVFNEKISAHTYDADTEGEEDFTKHHATSMYAPDMGHTAEKDTYDFDDLKDKKPGHQVGGKDTEDRGYEPVKESLITEGGAYGHMNHPFDISMNLTFGDLKKIINNALDGKLGVVREKTDGQALAISWKNGRLIAARNKGHLANGGASALDMSALASKFGGRGALSDAYNFAMKDLSAAISGLGEKERQSIFKDGSAFCNLEVIYPENANVIPYGQSLLIFHNVVEYDEKGNAVGAVKGAESKLASMIKNINAHVQSKYTLQGPPITRLPKDEKLSSQKGKFNGMLSKLQSEFNLSDKDGVAEYHYAWWMNFINKSKKNLAQLEKEGLARRWAFDNKSFTIKSIADEDARKWADGVDKDAKDKIMKGNLRKFEDIFLGVGAEVLSFMSSVLTAQPDSALQSIKSSLESSISDIRSGGSEAQIKRLEKELARLNAIGGFEKLVPNEGLVFFYKGNTYKLTGTFAPLNQILGIFKFGR